MRGKDWESHPLGDPSRWPQGLRSSVRMMLNTLHPMVLSWGAGGYLVWNDSFAESLGAAADSLVMGNPAKLAGAGVWRAVGDQVAEVMRGGGPTRHEDRRLPPRSAGGVQESYWTYSCSPVDEDGPEGPVGGALMLCQETTKKVLLEKRLGQEFPGQVQSEQLRMEPSLTGAAEGAEQAFAGLGEACGGGVGERDGKEGWRLRGALKKSERERRRLSRALDEQLRAGAELDRILRNAHELIVSIDMSGVLRAVNEACSATLGWRPEEMVGRHLVDFIHEEDRPPMRDGSLIAERYAKPRIFINRFRHKDGGYRSISWSSGIEGGMVYSHGRDITRELQQAEALREAEAALLQSQKMEAVGQLAGGLAHDFNNLLMGIAGNLQIMQSRVDQGRAGEVSKYASAAQSSVKRAAALTHRLLDFSRRQAVEPREVDVNKLLGGMEELIRRAVGPQVELSFRGDPGLWPALVDPNQLENALLNLCINARDAMPEGGIVTIETANLWLDERAALEHGLPAGPYLEVCVTDNGTGMDPEVAAKAFDPFFTTKPMGLGTGLGLSMIYGFVRESGGQAVIHSRVGSGTKMCLMFPRHGKHPAVRDAEHTEAGLEAGAEGPATAGPQPKTGPGAGGGPRATVLVVDDEPSIRELISEALVDAGYLVRQAKDGKSALGELGSTQVDLLLTDVGLPGGMNGIQLAQAAREGRTDLKVLFMTGYGEGAIVGEMPMDENTGMLTKPFEIEELRARIEALVRHR